MIFHETSLQDACLIEIQKLEDERGFFARTWCQREFSEHGLNPKLVQCNLSYNRLKGTLRGMHYQTAPHEEAKLIRCSRGSFYDLIIDLRPGSQTYLQHFGVTLTEREPVMLYVPEGFAHGFLTLEDETCVFYQMSEFYAPEYSRGLRWNDPSFRIKWPAEIDVISARDANHPDFIG